MARYERARTAPKAASVTGPARPASIRSATLDVGAAPPAPTVNVKPPVTGCESAEITR